MTKTSSVLDCIQAINRGKKSYLSFCQSDFTKRKELLDSALQKIKQDEDLFKEEACDESLPLEFVLQKTKQAVLRHFEITIEELNQKANDPKRQPAGLCLAVFDGALLFRNVCDTVVAAVAAGNTVLGVLPESRLKTLNRLQQLFSLFPEGVVQFLATSDSAQIEMLVSHPSVSLVVSQTEINLKEPIYKAAASLYKRFCIRGGKKNSALVLSDYNKKDLKELVQSLVIAGGSLPWSISKIFVAESLVAQFKQDFLAELAQLVAYQQDQTSCWSPLNKIQIENFEQAYKMAKAEGAKVLFEKKLFDSYRFAIVENLSNCSTLQLEDLNSPLIILNTVKYAHEMTKWVNLSEYGNCVLLIGPTEKTQKLSTSIECAQVFINDWISSSGPTAGWKKSTYGQTDLKWSGHFFSNIRA
jgi:acyl-CoA reductase-like NAD-dependent aldehyde dehydrogenase